MARKRMMLNGTISPPALADLVRLRYVSDDTAGFTRRRNGSGFIFLDTKRQRIANDRTLSRIQKLVIPPAWAQVWICPHANGHIQVTGRDARGRKQYIYHVRWQKASNLVKFCKLQQFGSVLPKLRRAAHRELERDELDRRQLIAALVLLLDATSIRIGNEEYVKENSSYGLTTLRCRHLKLMDKCCFEFDFRGKSGLRRRVCLKDQRLAELITRCSALKGSRLFQYPDPETGKPKVIEADDVNSFMQEITDYAFTAKDFRTWKASAYVAGRLCEQRDVDRITHTQRVLRQVIREAAEQLGNTPTVCRNYYVHPGLLDSYREGTFQKMFDGFTPKRRKFLSADEQILGYFLEHWKTQPVEDVVNEVAVSAA